jgi:hypothetical protein
MNIFQRAYLNLDLYPQERAFLKWFGAVGLASPWVVLVMFVEWWLLPGGIIWWSVIGLALILFFVCGSIGITKFFTSQKDGPTKIVQEDVQNIFNTVMARVEAKLEMNAPLSNSTSVVPIVKPPEPIVIPTIGLPQQPPTSST